MIVAEDQTRRNKRRRELPNLIINCDKYINLEGGSSSMVKKPFQDDILFYVLYFIFCSSERKIKLTVKYVIIEYPTWKHNLVLPLYHLLLAMIFRHLCIVFFICFVLFYIFWLQEAFSFSQ